MKANLNWSDFRVPYQNGSTFKFAKPHYLLTTLISSYIFNWTNLTQCCSWLISKHLQYCQSDTNRESTSRPDKLLQTVNILYGPSLFVSAIGVGWSACLICRICQQFIRSVQSVRIVSQFTTWQTVTNRKYAFRSVSIPQRKRWSDKALLNRQNMWTVRTIRTICTDREPIHDPSHIVRQAVVG